MNAYEGAKRMYGISSELEALSEKLGNTNKSDERTRIEQSIDILEVEFFEIKHTMEKRVL